MSLDFSLYAMRKTCVADSNITHNVSPMWRKAGVFEALYQSQGKTAGEILETLRNGLSMMRRNPFQFEALNPSNGWGDYESALKFLSELVDYCDTNPDAEIHVSA